MTMRHILGIELIMVCLGEKRIKCLPLAHKVQIAQTMYLKPNLKIPHIYLKEVNAI